MCTLSLLPAASLTADGETGPWLRVVFNRDERLTRPPARLPAVFTCGTRRAVLPVDAEGGGTWIAANDASVVFALLNVNPPRHTRGAGLQPCQPPRLEAQRVALRTRGAIIPELLECATAAAALRSLGALDVRVYRPFRLLVFDARGWWAEMVWTGAIVARTLARLTGPLMRTSSSLGDEVVRGARRQLFDIMSRRAPAAAMQDRFHRHRWPGHGAISVLMHRADARTVSITTVEVGPTGTRMRYEAL